MLEELRIRGLGVIDDAELEFHPGLTVLTGETGAGKTMVLTALGLLLGGRSDPGLVRPGQDRAVVEGRVGVAADGPPALRALEAGAELDEGTLLLGRVVSSEGRSRAHLGGRAVPAAVLTEVGDALVAVHGQSDQHRLLHPARQREALDRYAGERLARELAAYSTVFARLRRVDADLAEITQRARERAQEADLLRFGLAEVEAVAPEEGEDAAMAAEGERLAHAEALREGARSAQVALAGDESTGLDTVDVLGLLAGARRALEAVREHDAELARTADRVAECSYLLADLAADLGSYVAAVEADPARLAAVQDRQAQLGGLLRKYGSDVAAVLSWSRRAAERLFELDGDDERLEHLGAERLRLREELGHRAAALSTLRTQAATRLARAVTAELTALAMPHATVEVAVRQREDGDGLPVDGRVLAHGATGVDEVELLLSPHRGATPRPLHRGASGGELSRVMLAVEVVLAGTDPVPTFVFDEVDAGVGGAAAVEVGRRLAVLARTSQVIVVTHLPQVAAFADRHLRVVKTDDGRVTRSGVVALDEAARVRELSRMLAGLEGSESATAHAQELVQAADAAKRLVRGDAA